MDLLQLPNLVQEIQPKQEEFFFSLIDLTQLMVVLTPTMIC